MKLAISANSSWNLVNFRSGLIGALRRKGCTVIAVAPPDTFSAKVVKIASIYIPIKMDVKGTSPIRDAMIFLEYVRILRQSKPDILLTFTIKPNIYGSLAARLLGIPVVNNVSGLGATFIDQNWVTRVIKLLYKFSLGHSALVFFQNPDDRDLFVSAGLVSTEQAFLLPGSGVDIEMFKPTQPDRSSTNLVKFILIARLLWDKGVREFVEAATSVKAKYPNACFSLLGPTDSKNPSAISRNDLSSWIDTGVIEYLGETQDVRPHLAASDCVVLPSYREGTPRSLLEAGAMAKPLIATDVPGCREVVRQGQNGFLCRPKDSADLAKNMIRFMELSDAERSAMGMESRTIIVQEFDEKFIVEKYIKNIDRILRC